jgi:hypothetical protein
MASKLPGLFILIVASAISLHAQIPSGSSARSIPEEIEKMDVRVAQVISQAEARFKEGELHLKAGEPRQAHDKFDRAIDTILESGFDVRASQKLQDYYMMLVARIYDLEVPQRQKSTQPEVILRVPPDYSDRPQNVNDVPQQELGFKHQKFEPSARDEYGKPSVWEEGSPFGSKCDVRPEEAPALRGFRLGMEIAEVRKALSDFKMIGSDIQPRDELGASSVVFRGTKGASLKGVSKLALKFLDDRVTSISVTYDGSVKWDNAAQFLSRINTALSFPDAWRFTGPRDTGEYKMTCRGLNLEVDFNAGLYPTLTFNNSEAPKIVIKRKEEKDELRRRAEAEREEKRQRAEEERRKEFKP